ncbi:MAG: hypothetical protein ACP5RX_00215 [Minisyncoccia bacterium]
MCGPLCAVGIAGGLWLSRLLGINDLTLGLWIGALILSLSVQINKFLFKRKKNFPFSFWVIFILTIILSFLPIWHQLDWSNLFCGLPRVIAGTILGMLILFISDLINNFLIKKFHQNKVYFPYQRVIVPIVVLIIVSFIFELWLCKILI